MSTVTIEVATQDRFSDAQRALSGGGDGASCQCQWVMLTNKEWQETSAAEREELFEAEFAEPIAPGLVAYLDGEAVGWVRVAPRPSQRRLGRTRMIIGSTKEPLEDTSVWAISCFSIREEGRGEHLMAQLIDAAVNFAKENGARVIEAYPIDTSAGKVSSNDLFHGSLSTFEKAGFSIVDQPTPKKALVALEV